MNRKIVAFGLLLVCSHLLVFFASRPDAAAVGASGPEGESLNAKRAGSKSRLRGEEDGVNSYRRLLVELDASDLKGSDYKDARDALMIEWIRKDLRGAIAHFFSPQHYARFRMALNNWSGGVSSALAEEMVRQPLQSWDWISSDSYGSNRRTVIKRWVYTMRNAGRRDVLLARAAEGEKYMEDPLFEECQMMNAEELRQMRELWDKGLYRGMSNAYVGRQLELADGDFRTLYDQENDPKLKEALLPQWVSQEISILPMEKALDRLDEVPEELLPEALRLVTGAVSNNDGDASGEGVVKLLEELDRRDLWRLIPEREVGYFISQQLSYEVGRSDPGLQVEQLGAIDRDDLRQIALREAGRKWAAHSSSDDLLQSMKTLHSGENRDRFISGVLEYTHEKEVFAALREQIEDPAIKEKAPKEPWVGEGG
ncbi:hypothetical protein [Luteolibacter luteus]|uniref:Uncharacterized protein n=1 Tax=Luteolibacter luteus TaxID=2728835 RepID=A0A858RFN7_9BACT|nr:hypothetical protein [Luteolibacter luteus]QJE94953.1 hypothetical protein HHL09_03885 [Luteolibacter luteus]